MNTELKNRPTISSEREKRHRSARIAIGIACVLLALFIAWDISKLAHKPSTKADVTETAPSSGGAAPGYGTPGSGN